MKYLTVILLFMTFTVASFSQVSVRGGMGISFVSMPSLTDYLNQNFVPPDQQLGTFNSSVIFSGEGYVTVRKNYEVGIEVAYLLNSYTFDYTLGHYQMAYDIIMPSLTGYYVISGTGFNFKFGAGVGPRFVSANETLPARPSADNYTSTGFGVLLRAEGNTLLGGNLYANIGADLRYDFNGEPKNGGKNLYNNVYGKNVNMNSFSAGLRLGVTYIF
jgi:hypothetical protein